MNYQSRKTCRKSISRKGSVYLAVMGVAMIISIIALSSMTIARLQLKGRQNMQDLEQAQILAHSGVEFGMGNLDFVSDWRSTYTNDVECVSEITVGDGTMTYKLVDEDGDLNDNATDSVRMIGVGRVGDAVYAASVLLEPGGDGLSSLESAIHSDDSLTVGSNTTLTVDEEASSNTDVSAFASGASIDGDAWAAGIVTGTVTGSSQSSMSPDREMPDSTTVFDYYITQGTTINYSDLPSGEIDKQLISPNSNPFGSETNSLGIYVIDCDGNTIVIKDSRILGTIVLLDVGANSQIDKDIHWEPVVSTYPALLVDGDLEMKWHGDHTLDESKAGVNFNPTGSPYLSVEDSDTDDEYPGVIRGLIYIAGKLDITHECVLEGVVIVEDVCNVNDNTSISYDSSILSQPPPGFTSGTEMQIVPGTWQRVAY